MNRRQVLLGTVVVLAGTAGCSENSAEGGTNAPTGSPTETPFTELPTETSTPASTPESSPDPSNRETPSEGFKRDWTLDRDDDWSERRRETEYPNSHEAVDWTPDYAYTVEYAHLPSRDEFATAIDVSDAPPLGCAVASKWALPAEFSGTSVDLAAEVRNWFSEHFYKCAVNIGNPELVEPSLSTLDSGREIGRDGHEAEGETGRLEPPLSATVDGDPIEIERISYEAEGVLLGFVHPRENVGYLVGGGWPKEDSVTLHTVENGEMGESVTVAGESWGFEDTLTEVLERIE